VESFGNAKISFNHEQVGITWPVSSYPSQ